MSQYSNSLKSSSYSKYFLILVKNQLIHRFLINDYGNFYLICLIAIRISYLSEVHA